jgi:hypothetical protein
MGAVVRAGDYLRRFGSLVGIGGDQEVEAARRLEKKLDVRRNPNSISAAVIYNSAPVPGNPSVKWRWSPAWGRHPTICIKSTAFQLCRR